MRFSAPRSLSPSPERVRFSGRSSYGLYPESDSDSDEIEDEGSSEYDSESVESSESGDSYLRLSDLKITRPEKRSSRCSRTDAEMRYIEDTIAAIRLRTRHRDPYEEWEQQTRKDAFRTAKRSLTESQNQCQDDLAKARAVDLERLSTLHAQQAAEVQSYLGALRQQQQKEEQKLRDNWKARDHLLWERIETVIKVEEDRTMKKIEEERRVRQEAETKQRLEEEKKRMEEEERLRKEAERRKEEEEARKQKEEKERSEAEAKRREVERLERQKAEQEQRQKLGLSTVDGDWSNFRQLLHQLKHNVVKRIKADKQLKKEWGDIRRQITPKIGQLTNDDESVSRISEQLISIVKPGNAPPRNRLLYIATLSSLAKAILMQAETEVTAEPRTAVPLAKVTVRLLSSIQEFGEVLHTRLVQRVGSLAIPIAIPATDFDGRPWKDNAEKMKVMGYRKGPTGEVETTSEYCTRIAGLMRVYFHVLKLHPSHGPLQKMFQAPRYWTWFARMLGGQYRSLLEMPASAFLIHTGLAIMGTDAKDIWGVQWIKVLALIYQGVTEGLPTGSNNEKLLIGGLSAEGRSARTRAFLEVERIMNGATATVTNAKPPTLFS